MSIPFNGDFYDSNGEIRNLMDNGVSEKKTPKDYMSPFNGDFYASDGSIHNIDELIGGYTPNNGMPKGCIVMWSGAIADTPSGWALCDGTNGTPDLRNRFVVGAGITYEVGSTGGSDSIVLTSAQLPSHSHSVNRAKTVGSMTYAFPDTVVTALANANTTEQRVGFVANTGNGQAHENRPPYYALAFIMKL